MHPVEAKPAHLASDGPRDVVRRLYELISGAGDYERDWDSVRALFLPDATLRSELTLPDGTHQSGTWTVAEFCTAAAEEYRKDGFWEREIAARMERFGTIAHVWSTYESRVGGAESTPAGRGINSFQLLQQAGVWRLASVVFQLERGTDGIPSRYLSGDGSITQGVADDTN